MAKPKRKCKSKTSSPLRRPPTKKKEGGAKRVTSTSKQVNIQPTKKLVPISKLGGGSTTDAHQKTLEQNDVHPQTKIKRKIIKTQSTHSPPHTEQRKKRAKKLNSAHKKHHNVSQEKHQGMIDTNTGPGRGGSKRNGGDTSSQNLLEESLHITGDSNIEKVVSGLVDMVAAEIHYCASVFRPVLQHTVDDEPSADARYLPSFHPEKTEFKSNTTLTSSFSSKHADMTSLVASSPSYYDKMSTEGMIHPIKRTACSPKKGCKTSTDTVSRATSQLQEQGRHPNLKTKDVQNVVTAIRRFVLEVYYPFLLSAKQNTRNSSPSAERIRISTLLAIREMLIMNAETLFTFSYLNQSPTKSVERDGTYLSHVFANAIVRNTAKQLHVRYPGCCFLKEFVQAARKYDARSEEFQTSLARADVRAIYAHSDGTRVGQQESVLAKVSFNYARARHPLLSNNKSGDQLGQVNSAASRTHPAPTAFTAFQIESDTACDETDDDARTLESLKNVLRRKYK